MFSRTEYDGAGQGFETVDVPAVVAAVEDRLEDDPDAVGLEDPVEQGRAGHACFSSSSRAVRATSARGMGFWRKRSAPRRRTSPSSSGER